MLRFFLKRLYREILHAQSSSYVNLIVVGKHHFEFTRRKIATSETSRLSRSIQFDDYIPQLCPDVVDITYFFLSGLKLSYCPLTLDPQHFIFSGVAELKTSKRVSPAILYAANPLQYPPITAMAKCAPASVLRGRRCGRRLVKSVQSGGTRE